MKPDIITHQIGFELASQFFNALNNINSINFLAGPGSSNTGNPGGRLIQIVARFNI